LVQLLLRLIVLAAFCLRAGAATPITPSVLIERAQQQMNKNPEAAKANAEAALQRLIQDPDADLAIRAHLILCNYYSDRDYKAREQQSAAAMALLGNAKRPGLRAGVLTCQGETAEGLGDLETARARYEAAVVIATKNADNEMLAGAVADRGFMRGVHGDYPGSLTDLRHAQTLYEQLGRPADVATTIHNIAIIYTGMGDHQEAVELFETALNMQRVAGLMSDQANTLTNLGRSYLLLGKAEVARRAFSESLVLSRQFGLALNEAYGLRGLAGVATMQHDPKLALGLLDQAVKLQGSSDVLLRARILYVRGEALEQLERFKESESELLQALEIFKRNQSAQELAKTFDLLAMVSAELGNWRGAYDYQRLAQGHFTQILREQLDHRFALLRFQYDTATTEKENQLLTQENAANLLVLKQQHRVAQFKTGVISLSALLLMALIGLVLYLRRSGHRMRALAMTDELTGVPNRRAVLERLDQLLRDSIEPTSILVIDIDYFKTINDRFGHPIGDETLKMVAAQLRVAAHPALFGRLGGEEFAVVLANSRLAEARAVAEHLREATTRVDLHNFIGARHITVSIGVATSINGNESITSMLSRADSALYAAKGSGRNCVRVDSLVSLNTPPRVA